MLFGVHIHMQIILYVRSVPGFFFFSLLLLHVLFFFFIFISSLPFSLCLHFHFGHVHLWPDNLPSPSCTVYPKTLRAADYKCSVCFFSHFVGAAMVQPFHVHYSDYIVCTNKARCSCAIMLVIVGKTAKKMVPDICRRTNNSEKKNMRARARTHQISDQMESE